MTTSTSSAVVMPDDRPPGWANSVMRWALRTPVFQGTIGQSLALLTFTGRRSGEIYTIPVSYQRDGDVVTIVTKRMRRWWHNFDDPAEVELRLAGQTFRGKAELQTDETEVLQFMVDYLEKRPIDARAYGLGKGQIVREEISRIVPQIVVIRIQVAPSE